MKPSQYSRIIAIVFCIVSTQLKAQTIGLVMDSYVTDRWYKDQKFFTDRVKELGGEVQIEVAYGDPDQQVRECKSLIANGVKVLVVVPVDAQKAAEIAELAKAANIPLISYDRLILSKDIAMYVSYDNEKVGELQAQYVLNKTQKGNYLMVNGPVSDNNAILFRRGQLKVLTPAITAKKIVVLEDMIMEDWGELGALMRTDQFFSYSKEKLDVIMAANDALAAGVIQALPKTLQGKLLITGQDADVAGIQHIIDGTQSMTVYKPIKPLAYLAAEIAMKLANGKPITGGTKMQNGNITINAILLTPIAVDINNYKETVIKDGHILMSDLTNKN
jgi:D-xylose ABC transporter substrate-binding protein